MIAIDANILVYAHRRQTEWHSAARACVAECWNGDSPWMIPWPCLHEFFAVVTNPRIPVRPSTIAEAAIQIDEWLHSPSLVLAAEHNHHWQTLRPMLLAGRITGSQVYDGKIAAICLRSNVTVFWTADRDYARFPALRCENPLVARK